MNLYKLTQTEVRGSDTYDSCVVAARTLEDALQIHPSEFVTGKDWPQDFGRSWAGSPEKVNAEYIGKAAKGTLPGIICASFNAG